MAATYEQSTTRWYWDELRAEAQPLPADLEHSDHMISGSLIRKRGFRKLTWTLLDEIWSRIAERRKTMPETGGILFEGGVEVTPEAFLQGFGKGRFGFCLRIAAAMCHTMRLISTELRQEQKWAPMMQELDTEIAEMVWELRLAFLDQNNPAEAQRSRQLRAQGTPMNQIFTGKTTFEGFFVDEIESPFRIYAGLALVLLNQEPTLEPAYIGEVLRNSAPLARDWANQSMAAFEETRMAQGFQTQRSAQLYGDCLLPISEAYRIVGEETQETRLEFSDSFVMAHLPRIKAMVREHSPHRIGCGGLRKTAVAEQLDFVTDSLYWFVEILMAHGTGIHALEVDY